MQRALRGNFSEDQAAATQEQPVGCGRPSNRSKVCMQQALGGCINRGPLAAYVEAVTTCMVIGWIQTINYLAARAEENEVDALSRAPSTLKQSMM